MSKLKDLIALNILGWKSAKAPDRWACDSRGKDGEAWELPNGELVCKRCQGIGMEPETDLNDALVCLERAAQGKGYSIYMFPEEKKPYDVELEVFKVCTDAKTLPLAMCLCSLRAMGVPESEISLAMED